jgi:hypothetical protein
MDVIGSSVEELLPEGYGFFVLVFEFGKDGAGNYVSNASWEDVQKAMRHLLTRRASDAGPTEPMPEY